MSQLQLKSYQSETAQHQHSYSQVVLALQGALELDLDGYTDQVSEKRFVWVPENTPHAFCGSGTNQFLVLDLYQNKTDTKALFSTSSQNQGFRPVTRKLSALLTYAKCCPQAFFQNTSQCKHFESLLLDEIVDSVEDYLPPQPAHLKKAMQFIDQNFVEDIDITKIARFACVSISTLKRSFAMYLNSSPSAYLRNRRLQSAKIMLTSTLLPMTEIALRSGFKDTSTLSRNFSKYFGNSPHQFRKTFLDQNARKLS